MISAFLAMIIWPQPKQLKLRPDDELIVEAVLLGQETGRKTRPKNNEFVVLRDQWWNATFASSTPIPDFRSVVSVLLKEFSEPLGFGKDDHGQVRKDSDRQQAKDLKTLLQIRSATNVYHGRSKLVAGRQLRAMNLNRSIVLVSKTEKVDFDIISYRPGYIKNRLGETGQITSLVWLSQPLYSRDGKYAYLNLHGTSYHGDNWHYFLKRKLNGWLVLLARG